jgi:hypothetical protein
MKFLLPILFLPALEVSAQIYSDASANLPSSASGANMDVRAADFDNDGDLDLVFAREFQANFLLRNNGAAVFSNATTGNLPQEIHDSEDVAIADFNGDGQLDLVFCSEDDVVLGASDVHEYYLGDGTGKFAPAAYQPPDSEANAVITADLNGDGFPDLIFGNKGTPNVLINDGQGSFVAENNRLPAPQRTTQDLALIDVDGDGDPDVMAGNENGNWLMINDGAGHFSDATAQLPLQSLNLETRKIAVGDVDGDGDQDIFLANVQFIAGKNPQNRLFLNDGAGTFSDATATGLPADTDHTIDAIFEDVDLDNDLDIVVANVFGAPLKIYGNNGAGVFSDVTEAVLEQLYYRDALGVIAEDFNGDGLRDLYVCHRRAPQDTRKDLLLLRSGATAAPEFGSDASSVLIFPNPVTDHCRIATELPFETLHLLRMDGSEVARLSFERTGEGRYRCALPSGLLPAGVGWLCAKTGTQTVFTRKIFLKNR